MAEVELPVQSLPPPPCLLLVQLHLLDPSGQRHHQPGAVRGESYCGDVVVEGEPPGVNSPFNFSLTRRKFRLSDLISSEVRNDWFPDRLENGGSVPTDLRSGSPELRHPVLPDTDQGVPQGVGGEVHHAPQVAVQDAVVLLLPLRLLSWRPGTPEGQDISSTWSQHCSPVPVSP